MSLDHRNPVRTTWHVAAKEMTLFLASPVAWLFFVCFAVLTLFIVFWGEAFFARNIADVRPMFEWMPVLLILLCSTLTMRMWSEERRTGTLEHVLTQATPLWCFAVGKYLACLALLTLALLVVSPFPISVSFMTEVDWGPIVGGFVATLLLGSAYLAIGLFVSSRTQNQIVSLIGSVTLCAVFYGIGHGVITESVNQASAELLRSLGTGARFDAISRGVIDIADLVYYTSLTIVFLVLSVYMLERERWSQSARSRHHRFWQIGTVLLVLNAIALNLWVGQIGSWRLDTTRGQQYTLSDATRNFLSQLQEPLILRGYFSAKTHPLLSPLVPQMRDLLREYEVAGDGRVRVEIIDPMQDPEAEEEANGQYGIEPVPFQVADRYQSSIVSSYFDVLVQYGDEYEVLGFRDLIDIKTRSEADIDVQLRNPEYDVTRAIRRVLTDFQSAGDVFASISEPVTLTAYVSGDDRLPADLVNFKNELGEFVDSLIQDAAGKLSYSEQNPENGDGALAASLTNDLGLRPMRAGLFSTDEFWFHLLLSDGEQLVQLPLDDLTRSSFESNLEAGLKRYARGFTRRVAIVGPPPYPMAMQQSMQTGMPPVSEFRTLEDFLRGEYDVLQEDLSDGSVGSDVDLLVLAAPAELDEKALFAIDQFLMQGGTVIAATSNWSAGVTRNSLDLQANTSGLSDWLSHHGIDIGNELVMDPQNAAFPVPVARNVGGMQIQEVRLFDYPYFVDVRRNGMAENDAILAGLDQVTLPWASPITIDATQSASGDEQNGTREELTTTVLMESSSRSWLTSSTDIMPRLDAGGNPLRDWSIEGDQASHVLAVASQGRFESYFAGKPSPLVDQEPSDHAGESSVDDEQGPVSLADNVDTVIERSPESARLIVFASNDFLKDQITQLAGSVNGSTYLAPFQLMANAVDASLDDTGLSTIRSRGQFNRTLPPMDTGTQKFWEYLNYALAALVIVLVYGVARLWRHRSEQQQLRWLAS